MQRKLSCIAAKWAERVCDVLEPARQRAMEHEIKLRPNRL